MTILRRLIFLITGYSPEKKNEDAISGGSTLSFLLPKSARNDFEVRKLKEGKREWTLIAREKQDRIPAGIPEKDAVLNGFERKIEVIGFPLQGKPLYLHFYRRKWKRKGERRSYSNTYDLHPQGVKVTREFGDFLKELSRQERSEFFRAFPDIRHLRQEDLPLVP